MLIRMVKKWAWIAIPILGVLVGLLLMNRSVNLVVDGSPLTVKTNALTVNGALRSAGIKLSPGDSLAPSGRTFLSNVQEIRVNRAGSLALWLTPESRLIPVQTTSRVPAEIIRAAGLNYHSTDSVRVNGQIMDASQPLPQSGRVVIQYTPAVAINLTQGVKKDVLESSTGWLGKALWENGIHLNGASQLSLPFDQPLHQTVDLEIIPPLAVTIEADGLTFETLVRRATTGEALASAGISLQDLDYSVPADDQPLPLDGRIRVVRVREEVNVEESLIPFKTEYVNDSTLDLDQTKIVTLGVPGIQVVKVRTRFENGVQVSQTKEEAVVLREPVNQKEAHGTQFTIKTLDTPSGPISYYRAVTVRVTSYSPCRSGGDRCYYGTSSGLPVKKGVIGVTRDWYRLFAMDQIYVPGYGIGTVADVGGGIPGSYWIDLGYSDADWVPWYGSVTIYFLTPVPANVPAVLP
jgi:uncharacterized protein YabE (DUF348 family)